MGWTLTDINVNAASGQDISDEKVVCDEAVTINGTTYYVGFLNWMCMGSIVGNSHATYGVWTSAAKGGSRLEVLTEGEPSGPSEIAIDTVNGWVKSDTQRTVYVYYRGLELPKHWSQAVALPVNMMLADGESYSGDDAIARRKFPRFQRFAGVCVDLSTINGITALKGDLVLMFANGASGDSQSVTFVKANGRTQYLEFSDFLKVTTDQELYVTTTDGQNFGGGTITLFDV